jgi:hypothetical protein
MVTGHLLLQSGVSAEVMDPISYKIGSLRINVTLQRVCINIDSVEKQ